MAILRLASATKYEVLEFTTCSINELGLLREPFPEILERLSSSPRSVESSGIGLVRPRVSVD